LVNLIEILQQQAQISIFQTVALRGAVQGDGGDTISNVQKRWAA
jgi:hypothetical protein